MKIDELIDELGVQSGPAPDMFDARASVMRHVQRRRWELRISAGIALFALLLGGAALAWTQSSNEGTGVRVQSGGGATETTGGPATVASLPAGWHEVTVPSAGVSIAVPQEWTQFPAQSTDSAKALVTVGHATEAPGDWLSAACSTEPSAVATTLGTWITLYEYPASMSASTLPDPVYGTSNPALPSRSAVPRPSDFAGTNDASSGWVGCGNALEASRATSNAGYAFQDEFFIDAGRVFVARTVTTEPVVTKDLITRSRQILNNLRVTPSTVNRPTNLPSDCELVSNRSGTAFGCARPSERQLPGQPSVTTGELGQRVYDVETNSHLIGYTATPDGIGFVPLDLVPQYAALVACNQVLRDPSATLTGECRKLLVAQGVPESQFGGR